jgi:hypothetical protein
VTKLATCVVWEGSHACHELSTEAWLHQFVWKQQQHRDQAGHVRGLNRKAMHVMNMLKELDQCHYKSDTIGSCWPLAVEEKSEQIITHS